MSAATPTSPDPSQASAWAALRQKEIIAADHRRVYREKAEQAHRARLAEEHGTGGGSHNESGAAENVVSSVVEDVQGEPQVAGDGGAKGAAVQHEGVDQEEGKEAVASEETSQEEGEERSASEETSQEKGVEQGALEELTESVVLNMTVRELRKALHDRGLHVSGLKAVLYKRLLDDLTKTKTDL